MQKIRGSEATYKTPEGEICDLVELARNYMHWGNVPKNIGDIRAKEISLLAKAFLVLEAELQETESKEKVEVQKQIKALEEKRNEKRRQLYDAQDQIEREKDSKVDLLETQLNALTKKVQAESGSEKVPEPEVSPPASTTGAD